MQFTIIDCLVDGIVLCNAKCHNSQLGKWVRMGSHTARLYCYYARKDSYCYHTRVIILYKYYYMCFQIGIPRWIRVLNKVRVLLMQREEFGEITLSIYCFILLLSKREHQRNQHR